MIPGFEMAMFAYLALLRGSDTIETFLDIDLGAMISNRQGARGSRRSREDRQ